MADYNLVVSDSPWTVRDLDIIFEDEHVDRIPNISLDVLLAKLGIYKSTSEARRAGRQGLIPLGYSEIKASKKDRLFIWNPSE